MFYYKLNYKNGFKIILDSILDYDEIHKQLSVLFLKMGFHVSKIIINKNMKGYYESEIQIIANKSELNQLIKIIEELNYIEFK